MEDVEIPAEEKWHPRNLVNNEEGNIRDGEIWVNLNESRNDNPFELQQTFKELREKLKWVKEDKWHILKAHEGLNNIMLSKLDSNEK